MRIDSKRRNVSEACEALDRAAASARSICQVKRLPLAGYIGWIVLRKLRGRTDVELQFASIDVHFPEEANQKHIRFIPVTNTLSKLLKVHGPRRQIPLRDGHRVGRVCVCLLLQDLVQSCLHGGGGDMGGHVLRETTSRGLCGLVCPSRTSERGGEGDCVKEGGGEEGKCERERQHADRGGADPGRI
jgi:hypothetical protein